MLISTPSSTLSIHKKKKEKQKKILQLVTNITINNLTDNHDLYTNMLIEI